MVEMQVKSASQCRERHGFDADRGAEPTGRLLKVVDPHTTPDRVWNIREELVIRLTFQSTVHLNYDASEQSPLLRDAPVGISAAGKLRINNVTMSGRKPGKPDIKLIKMLAKPIVIFWRVQGHRSHVMREKRLRPSCLTVSILR